VGSESKYPITVSGLILMNGFVNTHTVDWAATPSVAYPGAGNTGATMRQTIVGLDARGPHLFGALSHADFRMDFDGTGQAAGAGYAVDLVRLRTAHAELDWPQTRAYFAYDRPILNPESPDSLTAVAQPALAWSGNLWTWNPQLGVSHNFSSSFAAETSLQLALVDVGDAPATYFAQSGPAAQPPSTAELSRWPGAETRFALLDARRENGARVGVSAFFAPHHTPDGGAFDSWAGAMDFHLPFSQYFQLSGNVYRGRALGGLGGGLFKDYVYTTSGYESYYHPLADEGGWAQWKQRVNELLEFNEAFGMDDAPAHQLLPYAAQPSPSYYTLARNRTFTGNVIYSPSAYLLFSLEYRRILSSFVNAPSDSGDVIGLAAGYKF
jgi:hypothetical protein